MAAIYRTRRVDKLNNRLEDETSKQYHLAVYILDDYY